MNLAKRGQGGKPGVECVPEVKNSKVVAVSGVYILTGRLLGWQDHGSRAKGGGRRCQWLRAILIAQADETEALPNRFEGGWQPGGGALPA